MKVERVDNRKGTGTRILALTDDELDYLVYILRMDDWKPNPISDPVGTDLHHKIMRLTWRK